MLVLWVVGQQLAVVVGELEVAQVQVQELEQVPELVLDGVPKQVQVQALLA